MGSTETKPRHAAVDVVPIFERGPRQAGRVGDGRQVQQQIRRAAEGREDGHRVADRGIGQDVGRVMPRSASATSARALPPGHVEPDRLAGRGQGRVRQRQAQRLAHDLGRGGRAEKMAAPAAGRTGPAAQLARRRPG